MTTRVLVVQNQQMWDATQQKFVPKFDLNPALEFGRLVYLLSPSASPFNPESYLGELREKLADYSDNDHLLCVGNPVLIGTAAAIAASANEGRVNFLQWSGKKRGYTSVHTTGLFTFRE